MAKPINPLLGPRDSPEYRKNYQQLNRKGLTDKAREYQRKFYRENPEKYLYWQVKDRARNKNLPFDLTFDDIVFPEICPVLDVKLARNIGKRGPSPNSPSIDRIIPELGYVKGNIQIISQRANTMKSDASVDELQRFADWVKKTYPS